MSEIHEARYKMLAHQWHMKRRYRLQGRITPEQWLDWAEMYIGNLTEVAWKQWCQRQVSDYRARQVPIKHWESRWTASKH